MRNPAPARSSSQVEGQMWIFFKVGLLSPLFNGKIGSLYAGSS
jgi:hypothetical protein